MLCLYKILIAVILVGALCASNANAVTVPGRFSIVVSSNQTYMVDAFTGKAWELEAMTTKEAGILYVWKPITYSDNKFSVFPPE